MIPSQDECRRMLAGLVGPVREAGALIMEIHARGVVSRDKPDGSPAKSPTSKSWARLKYQALQPDCRSLFALKKHTIKFFGEDIPAFANGDPINDVKAGILSFTTAASVAVLETDRDAEDVQPMEVDRMILAEAHQWAAAVQRGRRGGPRRITCAAWRGSSPRP